MSAMAILILCILGYLAVIAIGLIVSQRARVRLQEIALDMLDMKELSDNERGELEWIMRSSMSSAIGLALPLVGLTSVYFALFGDLNPPRSTRIERHSSYDELIRLYVFSVMACSPFATLIAAPAMILSVVVVRLRSNVSIVRAAEAPVMRASAQLRSC